MQKQNVIAASSSSSGFSALPAGNRRENSSSSFGLTASFWSRTESDGQCLWCDSTYAVAVFLYNNLSFGYIPLNHRKKNTGYAVRCLKTTSPSVTTVSVQNVDNNRALATGNIVADGGVPVTACGFCWSTSHNPTVADNHTVDSLNDGSFTSILTNLSNNTTYFIRAYATNANGTGYGAVKQFTTF